MSAVLSIPVVLEEARAVAEEALPVARPRPIESLAFYRRHTIALLRRYLHTSMEIGRTPCLLGNLVFRGRMSSYPMRSFEDQVIFVFDVEKGLKQLDAVSQQVVAHIALEEFSPLETATLMGDSERSIWRIYGQALDRLTRIFLAYSLLEPIPEKLSRG
ncbi:MAG TPA: hypothetical protein VMD25_02975 [Acidobacteriaceae bacterium]|nr:hypothetical protein [Acidobacteriaceae bacterium]